MPIAINLYNINNNSTRSNTNSIRRIDSNSSSNSPKIWIEFGGAVEGFVAGLQSVSIFMTIVLEARPVLHYGQILLWIKRSSLMESDAEKKRGWDLMTSPAVSDFRQGAFTTCASGSQKSLRRCRRWTTFQIRRVLSTKIRTTFDTICRQKLEHVF